MEINIDDIFLLKLDESLSVEQDMEVIAYQV